MLEHINNGKKKLVMESNVRPDLDSNSVTV